MARYQPPQQPPPVQKIRLKYTKTGSTRFASHRDISRVLERALRRANIPMAFSSGFHPHARISYAGAAPTGVESLAEYVEISLAERCSPSKVCRALDEQMPDGIRIVDACEATGGKLPHLLQASRWRIDFPCENEKIEQLVSRFNQSSTLEVKRMTKKGERVFDVKPSVIACRCVDHSVIVDLRHLEPLVRPDDIMTAFSILDPNIRLEQMKAIRLAQGMELNDGIGDPLLSS